jgi:molybdopterin-guanine dinucleotide biosynthesis adapter protein
LKVFGIAGFSGSGKTTLLENIIPRFVRAGLRVAVIKHVHHAFDLETPGKDSWRHREAGAQQVMIASARRWALLRELREAAEPELPELLQRLDPSDVVFVEGFKRQPIAKLEVHRVAAGKPPLFPDDPHVIALATDAALATGLPVFGLSDYEAIGGFIMRYLKLRPIDHE